MDDLQVARADRQCVTEALPVARAELTVSLPGSEGDGPIIGIGIALADVLVRGDHDPEGFASTARAMDLDEGDVVATGEDADPVRRDDLAASGAVDAVCERIEVVARIHRPQV